ncbi:MAG TPA: divalent-cation tolerance protein CutA [Rhabdochlamydiaceae bacterium]
MIYIFWTCAHKEESRKIIYGLLEKRLIACASAIDDVESIYRWEGKIEESREIKVILKTGAEHFDAILGYIEENGSYSVPEVIQVDAVRGNPKYLKWVAEEVD